ncbi:hypothetical protein LR48_Vigan05g130900 [Vigna angularis]|uniref:Uncharacterized protein n=1 Tax=Phaseolus angularis TaxID=3914 RepID=A0A0L9UMD4_PHAAN|nr:hypothetical protein LR48_Vigan05g130900 [Vigna angularis]
MGVLRELHVAPTQLHPNGWAFIQAFSSTCTTLALYPTPSAFLYFFRVQPHPNKPWISLNSISNRKLFTLFNSSYKDFKGNIFKVIPLESQITPEELDLSSQLSKFPHKSSSRMLINFLNNKNLHSNVFEWIRRRAAPSTACSPREGGKLKKKFGEGTSSHAPLTTIAPKPSVPTQRTHPPPTIPEVPTPNSTSSPTAAKKVVEAIHLSFNPTQKKKKNKRKVIREPFISSKRRKRALPNGPPFFGSLDTSSWVAKRIHFDLFVEEKHFVKGMTEEEASNMALELAARSVMCLAYATERKVVVSTKLQALQEKYDEAVKSNQELTLQLAVVERMAEEDKNKANTLFVESRSAQRKLCQRASAWFREGARLVQRSFPSTFRGPPLDVGMMAVVGELVPIQIPLPSKTGSSLGAFPKIKVRAHKERSSPSILDLRSSLGAFPKIKVRVYEEHSSPSVLDLRSSLGAFPKIKVRVHEERCSPSVLDLRSALGVFPKIKVRVHEKRSSPSVLDLRSLLGAFPNIKVRVHEERSSPSVLDHRSSLGAFPKIKVRVHEERSSLSVLDLRSSLGAFPKIKVRVHKECSSPSVLDLRSSLGAFPKIKVRVHEERCSSSILDLRSALRVFPKILVRVHEERSSPSVLDLRSSLGAFPKIKVRVHEERSSPSVLDHRSSLGDPRQYVLSGTNTSDLRNVSMLSVQTIRLRFSQNRFLPYCSFFFFPTTVASSFFFPSPPPLLSALRHLHCSPPPLLSAEASLLCGAFVLPSSLAFISLCVAVAPSPYAVLAAPCPTAPLALAASSTAFIFLVASW